MDLQHSLLFFKILPTSQADSLSISQKSVTLIKPFGFLTQSGLQEELQGLRSSTIGPCCGHTLPPHTPEVSFWPQRYSIAQFCPGPYPACVRDADSPPVSGFQWLGTHVLHQTVL